MSTREYPPKMIGVMIHGKRDEIYNPEYVRWLENTVTVLTEVNAKFAADARAYDARRRENMDSCEAWRQRCCAAEARLRALGEEVPE